MITGTMGQAVAYGTRSLSGGVDRLRSTGDTAYTRCNDTIAAIRVSGNSAALELFSGSVLHHPVRRDIRVAVRADTPHCQDRGVARRFHAATTSTATAQVFTLPHACGA